MDVEEVKSILSAIDDLIDIKVLIRKTVPNYKLDSVNYSKFIDLLYALEEKLFPIFSKYLDQQLDLKPVKTQETLKDRILTIDQEKSMILISANSSKKKLKALGIDPRIIIVSGGPLNPADYKVVNPSIPEKALINIKKKCSRLLSELKDNDWSQLNLYFIYESENITDQLIIKDKKTIEDIIGKELTLLELDSWNDLDL